MRGEKGGGIAALSCAKERLCSVNDGKGKAIHGFAMELRRKARVMCC